MDRYFQETIDQLNAIRLNELQRKVENMRNGIFDEDEGNIYRTDCYFYHEEHHMGGVINICCYDDERFSKVICPCKDCKNHISNAEVSKMVREKMD